ncbi:ABC transporter ATP-binding protein [Actinoallomurus purpureus]|uniref:ABC transporter ATP-binding protein n=1 Tax=Actinoallomurus purpureus TaxID=478114 RepID=UPI002092FFB4|nr:ABC transporter ATP-binding protein [Actinoallomurus purpureus]MCO6004454.1 ABC transporter ATP-binding protein [Actinoallomurus purpureus]
MSGAVLRAQGLGKRYRGRWALSDCTLEVPEGRVVGLVGPNGAGKTTLLSLAAGLLTPTSGTIEVCGGRPGADRAQLAKVGFVAQDTPTYARLTVAEHLTLGARLIPSWDMRLARERVRRLGLPPDQRAGNLSGGQRAQLALTLAVAKRPRLLILDEPVAALDPLARREFLQELSDATAGREISVVHSSHLVSDVERVCDHVIVLVGSRVRVAGDVRGLLAAHHLVRAPHLDPAALPPGVHAVSADRTDRQTTLLVRADAPIDGHGWAVAPVGLEDLVLAYMSRSTPALEGHR